MTKPTKLREYLGEEEWEDFQPTEALSPEVSGKLWNGINKNAGSAKLYYRYFKWTAAASVLLVIGLSWQLILKDRKARTIGVETVAPATNLSNTTPQRKTLTLNDGTTVLLSPNSTVAYAETFNASKRAVKLSGDATFTVAKDAARPFSVYSNSVLITVLGTRFTVKSYEGNSGTKIILHDGSVMVKVTDTLSNDGKKEYYLMPGDVFIFRKTNQASRVLHLEKDKNDCFVFNNCPLDVVFDQLQVIYNINIIYNKAALGNRSFIGKIDKKDSLYQILKSITLLNKFGLEKQGDSFIIH